MRQVEMAKVKRKKRSYALQTKHEYKKVPYKN